MRPTATAAIPRLFMNIVRAPYQPSSGKIANGVDHFTDRSGAAASKAKSANDGDRLPSIREKNTSI
jgi:hypothetical protein